MIAAKVCKRCELEKPVAEFRPDIRYKDGFGSWCSECHRKRNSEWAKENRARLSAKSAAWRRENKELAQAINRRFKQANKERLAAEHAEWAQKNKDKRRATTAKRKAAKLRATPAWADLEAIAAIYRRAAEIEAATGQRMHVDHIIPLQHPLVCGLHVPENLQILTGPENESKKNKWPSAPETKPQQLSILGDETA